MVSGKRWLFWIGNGAEIGIGKKVAIFDWEWGRNSAPREGQKMPCRHTHTDSEVKNKQFYASGVQQILKDML